MLAESSQVSVNEIKMLMIIYCNEDKQEKSGHIMSWCNQEFGGSGWFVGHEGKVFEGMEH